MNLIERVRYNMDDDEADTDVQAGYLARAWHEADAAGRESLDEAFIALCGYSLSTLINNP